MIITEITGIIVGLVVGFLIGSWVSYYAYVRLVQKAVTATLDAVISRIKLNESLDKLQVRLTEIKESKKERDERPGHPIA